MFYKLIDDGFLERLCEAPKEWKKCRKLAVANIQYKGNLIYACESCLLAYITHFKEPQDVIDNVLKAVQRERIKFWKNN